MCHQPCRRVHSIKERQGGTGREKIHTNMWIKGETEYSCRLCIAGIELSLYRLASKQQRGERDDIGIKK